MRTLAHLSDLHFGRVDPALLAPLRRRLLALAPDLVVVSGDLTQRARARQFRAARAFLDSLPKPQLVVPGNHDVPLYNVFARFASPLGGFQTYIARNPEPSFMDEEIAVLGLNTARSLVFKGGRVSGAQLARVREQLGLAGARTRILVAHHPLAALEDLAGHGVDVVVAGHLHVSRTGSVATLLVQAGTATSRRTREEPNAFNVLRIAPGRVEIERYALADGGFAPAGAEAFRRDGERWSRDGSG